jgi:hypothetical protein
MRRTMNFLSRVTEPNDVEGYLANCLDAWYAANPNLTVQEILTALESIRHKLTEGIIKYS